MAFIVDPTKFQAEGAIVSWPAVARRLRIEAARLPTVLHLRWMFHKELGLPTEPFIVWRRNRKFNAPSEIDFTVLTTNLFGLGRIVFFGRTCSKVILVTNGAGGVVYGFAGAPTLKNIVAVNVIPAGSNQSVQLTAPAIDGLIVSPQSSISSIAGTPSQDLTEAEGWEQLELVGLPVDKNDWAGSGIGQHGIDQGLFPLMDSRSAAKDRLLRGSPPIGWASNIEPGLPAPLWVSATPAVIDELQSPVLSDLQSIAMLPPNEQFAKLKVKQMPPPENSSGQAVSQPGSETLISPLGALLLCAGTDCFNCLALGFGTAYPLVNQGELNASDYDYMVTARYEEGLDGRSPAAEYAALVPSPTLAVAPPIPASMSSEKMGDIRPLAADMPWRASMRTSWEKPISTQLFRPRSFGFVSSGVMPPSPPQLQLSERTDGSPVAITINYFTKPENPENNRVSAVERELPIPNAPGSRTVKHSIAHQDIYGQWSPWVSQSLVLDQPPVDDVRIVSAELKHTSVPVPPITKCPADLVIEFLWDWRIRTPQSVSFRGRLFTAAFHGQGAPDTTLPGGLQTSLESPPSASFVLRFNVLTANGAPTSLWPGYDPARHCIPLDPGGESEVTFGAAQGPETRRYRLTIPGFVLNYATTGHIGLALWAQGREAIAPQRIGDWSDTPLVVSTSDPRPPLIIPDIVALTSLPDASGKAHARLAWSASPGATGYFVYESSESRLRARAKELGMPVTLEPDPDLTLSARLTELKAIFNSQAAKMRSVFTRVNSRLLTATSTDVVLPRGTTSIHVYIVQGVSAGQVEAQWPTSVDAMYAFAVPRVPQPAPPTLEVQSFLDVQANRYRTRVRMQTRPGPRVKSVELYRVRVDDAARELDTMGPPVHTINLNTPGWEVTHADDASPHIEAVLGNDTPSESWKRVWYRAVAWSAQDDLRGVLSTRSPASASSWVVIPPTANPDLSALTLEWPERRLEMHWSSGSVPAPLAKSPLGNHQLSFRARRIGAEPDELPLVAFDGPLSQLATAMPMSGPKIWRTPGNGIQNYHALIKRTSLDVAVAISVRITDPLGRDSEKLITLAPGHILPAPDLSDFQLSSSIIPLGQLLKWKSSTPLEPFDYSLRVTVRRPPFQNGNIFFPRPPIWQELALSDVPLDEPGPVPPGTDPLRIRRLNGTGPVHSYYAFVRVPMQRITVQLTSPDGRVASHTELTS